MKLRRKKMQYKGSKRIKKVVAVILSAALVFAEPLETSIVQAVETDVYVPDADTEQSAEPEGAQPDSSQAESGKPESSETIKTETESSKTTQATSEPESSKTTQTASEAESTTENPSENKSETESSTGTASEPTTESKTETESSTETTSEPTTETGTTETESTTETGTATATETESTSETGTTETEIQETEDITVNTDEQTFLLPPEIDIKVYEPVEEEYEDEGLYMLADTYFESVTELRQESGAYQINNKDEFVSFLADREKYADKSIVLNCDIDMNGANAVFDATFSGTFNGNGHSIVNFKSKKGLFRELTSGASVKNLHISKASLDGSVGAGIIAGKNSGTIENCAVLGNLKSTSAMDATAGIAGKNYGTIRNCVYAGDITAAAETAGNAKYIAGIAGRNSGIIEKCYAVGSVNTKASVVAGIAASNDGTIKNCYNYMSVTGTHSVAGVVAENRNTVTGCRNYGSITLEKSGTGEQAGGICAGNRDTALIEKSYNYGNITGYNNTAGVAGYTTGVVTESGNYGEISGSANVAGIVGLYKGAESNEIQKSVNKGRITGTKTGIGGILGGAPATSSVSIISCYNLGRISAASTANDIGGIAGVLMTGSISGCYNTGDFTLGNKAVRAGSIAGYIGSSVSCTGSYFKNDSLGCIYNKDNIKVAGKEYSKTAEELKAEMKGQPSESYQYPVIFEPSGGCFDRYFEIVDEGDTVTEPGSNPTKSSAVFEGWYADASQNKTFSFTSKVTGPRIAYAGWGSGSSIPGGVERIELLNEKVTMAVKDTYDIKVKFTPEDAENTKMTWKSDDESIATVDENGKVTAVKSGDTVIIGKLADGSLSTELRFKVTVSQTEIVIWIRDANDREDPDYGKDLKDLDIAAGEKYIVEAVISGNTSGDNRVTWSTTDDTVANVEGISGLIDGSAKAEITAKKPGKAKITAQYKDEIKILNVMVCPLADELTIKLDDRDVTNKTVIYDYATAKFIAVGTSKGNRLEYPVENLNVKVSPNDASQKVVWSVTPQDTEEVKDDEGVLEFVDKYSGKIRALSDGITTVTVRSTDKGKKSAKVRIRVMSVVNELTLVPEPASKNGTVVTDDKGRVLLSGGQQFKISPQYFPADATERKLSISCSDKNVLELIKDEGKDTYTVTAREVTRETEAVITARSLDLGPNGDGAEGSIRVVVKPKVTKINLYKGNDLRNPVTDSKIVVNPLLDERIFTLSVKTVPENSIPSVIWKSSNEAVATIEDNKDGSCTVTVKEKAGQAVITATAADGSGITAQTTISVEQQASEIIIKGSHRVMKGKTIKLTAEIRPLSAKNKNVTWESLNPKVAKIDKTTGVVTGVKAGDTQIVATSVGNSAIEAYYAMTVTEAIKDFQIIPDNDVYYDDEERPDKSIVLNNKSLGLDPDDQLSVKKLRVYVRPSTACQDVTWTSSDESVATVSADGTVTAVKLGNAVITAESTDGSGKKATVNVVVNTLAKSVKITGSHYIGTGKTIQLKAEVGGRDALNKAVKWSSSNSKAVSVDDKGNITAIRKNGTVTITAKAADGGGAYDTFEVYIMRTKQKVEIRCLDEDRYPIEIKSKKKNIYCDMNDQQRGSLRLAADFVGEAITEEPGEIKWSSSNDAVAEVDEDGNVTLVSDGKATITAASADGFNSKDTCTIHVENAALVITGSDRIAVGKKVTLSAGKTAISEWRSSNKSVATINSKGQVTAKKRGTVTITAIPKKGSPTKFAMEVTSPVRKVDIALDGGSTLVSGKKLGVDIVKGYNGNPNLSLIAIVDGEADTYDEYVTWKSSKKSVATVDKRGVVTPVKAGTAKITATAADGSGKKATVTVVVAKQVTKLVPENVKITESGAGEVSVAHKKSVQLSVGFRPLASTTKKVTWKVADEDKSYLSVSKTGKVTAKKYLSGKPYATVIATAGDNSGVTCEFHVSIANPAKKVVITQNGKSDEYKTDTTLGIDIDDESVKLGVKVTDTSGKNTENQKVTWKSGDKKILKVDSNGKITCLKAGTTTVTATVQDGTNKKCKINVCVGTIITNLYADEGLDNKLDKLRRKGDTLNLADYLSVRPITSTNQTFKYKSSNKKVVQVSSKGKITVKGTGTATITVTTTDGSNKELLIPITIS